MAKIIPITEHFQHFLQEMKESFWGDASLETVFGDGFLNRPPGGRISIFREHW
jgi:hypothetical protein